MTINSVGGNGHFYGSIVGETVPINYVTSLHYDEAMGDGGLIDNYRIVSWFEEPLVGAFAIRPSEDRRLDVGVWHRRRLVE